MDHFVEGDEGGPFATILDAQDFGFARSPVFVFRRRRLGCQPVERPLRKLHSPLFRVAASHCDREPRAEAQITNQRVDFPGSNRLVGHDFSQEMNDQRRSRIMRHGRAADDRATSSPLDWRGKVAPGGDDAVDELTSQTG